MRAALELARRAPGPPYPNPWVGCVLVKGGRVVGRGWHRGPGTDHAEVDAIRSAGSRARGAIAYVNLEPCCHYGRTPPCTSALIRAGVAEVVYAIRDPNPAVSGRGARLLRRAGIRVTGGVCAREARALNEVYLKYRTTGLPFVSLKVAASLDGKTATRTGRSKWITDENARSEGRRLRARHQAVLVGITTILQDDPHLGPRIRGAPENWRVVLDSSLRTPSGSQVVRSGKCIVACSAAASRRKEAILARRGVQVWRFAGRRIPLRPLLRKLAAQGIISVLVEGGSAVRGSFLDAKLVDRVHWFVAPSIIGAQGALSSIGGVGADQPSDAVRLRHVVLQAVGDGWTLTGDVAYP